jgi:hypothetical protein
MNVNLPPKVRATLYVATVILTPLVVYLKARNYIGDLELTLWSAEVMAVGALAAFNTKE